MEKKLSSLKSMPKKRLTKEQSKLQYIKNTIKTSKEVLAGFRTPEEAKYHYSNMYFQRYVLSNNDYTVNELLDPIPAGLTIKSNMSAQGNNKWLMGHNGIWRLYIHSRSKKSLDFDIAVKAGKEYRFHPKVIKHSIVSRHGKEVYEQWRKIAKDDIDSLITLVKEVQTRINCIPWSYTCSNSSANLCEQVGITTYRGTAFLFPESFA